ncbi:3382_t:CDS:1, partial [Funneliformis geosporum]
ATDDVGYIWEAVKNDNIISKNMHDNEKIKTHSLSVKDYINWIKSLEKAGLKYVRHDC